MRSIAIVGGGQAGLPVAFGLLAKGYQVTVVTNRTPDEIRQGKVMSSQCMFHDALEVERGLGINDWEDICPPVEGIGFAVPHPEKAGERAVQWSAPLEKVAQATDQRIKMPVWLEQLEQRGATVRYQDVGVAELEALAASNDLVLLAGGKGEIVKLLERDASRSPYDKPQRALALTYIHGLEPTPNYSRVSFNFIPGVGEYFVFPTYTHSGACDVMVFEGALGGPMDCWNNVNTPQEHLATSLNILNTFLPWEAERARKVELTDAGGILAGRFAPTVRKPVLTLPSGRMVLGIGDAVTTNDPITGQGSNNAAKCAKVYLDSILERGEQPFTREWMEQTFETYWDYARLVVRWTNSMLAGPAPHVLQVMGAAQTLPSLAAELANNFNHPPNNFPWWDDAQAAEQLIAQHQSRVAQAA